MGERRGPAPRARVSWRRGIDTKAALASGRNVQTAAMDLLLRLVRDLPDAMTYVNKHAP